MDLEFQELEETLQGLRPSAPEVACMDRLLAAVVGVVPEVDAGLERDLAKLRPSALPPAVSGRLLQVVSNVPFPGTEKVVLFPAHPASKVATKAPGRIPWIAAAAAVAVLGAFTAVMVDGPRQGTIPMAAKATQHVEVGSAVPSGFVPASMGSGVHDARDEGITWSRDGTPLRKVKVIYMDKVRYRGEDGRIIEFEQPRVEELLLPEKID